MTEPNKDLIGRNVRVLFQSSKRKKVNKIFITIEGKVVINEIRDIQRTILPTFDIYDSLSITLKNITEIDVSGIQLLHYISQFAKNVSIDSYFSEKDRQLVSLSGFSEFLHKPKLA
ncbi:MAG: hypothetical protein ABJG47_09610 [Ekhidna sp.]